MQRWRLLKAGKPCTALAGGGCCSPLSAAAGVSMGTGESDGAGAGAAGTLMALRVPSGAICETPENALRVPGRPAREK